MSPSTGPPEPRPLRRVAVLSPMPLELQPLIRPLALLPSGPGHEALSTGRIGGIEIVAVLSGMGTRAGASAALRVLDSGPVDHLLVVGIAGGIGPSVAVGDLVVPERVVDRVTGEAYQPAPLGAIQPRGTLVTGDELLVDPAEAARLAGQGVIAIDMETSAIGAVCQRRGCPWTAFRGISDRADDGSTDAAIFGLAHPDGTPNTPALLRFLLTRPWRIPQLVRLGRGTRQATRAAATAAVSALEGAGL